MTANTRMLGRPSKGQMLVNTPCAEAADPQAETLYPLREQRGAQVIEKCLRKKCLLRLAGDHRGERILCLSGVAWITQSGFPDDILVCAGETFIVTQKGAILIGGLADTRLKISGAG